MIVKVYYSVLKTVLVEYAPNDDEQALCGAG